MRQAVDLNAGLLLVMYIVMPVAASPVAALIDEALGCLVANLGTVVISIVEPPVWEVKVRAVV